MPASRRAEVLEAEHGSGDSFDRPMILLDQLCRYITRPVLANERVQTKAAGQVGSVAIGGCW
jgi:hypothetical protein